MPSEVPESDWKVFRDLRDTALDRYCKSVLDEIRRVLLDGSHANHERYLTVYRLLKERDKTLARAFNDPRLSTMYLQLIAIQSLGLLKPDELSRFTAETRKIFEIRGR